jgi:hypothetical protein
MPTAAALHDRISVTSMRKCRTSDAGPVDGNPHVLLPPGPKGLKKKEFSGPASFDPISCTRQHGEPYPWRHRGMDRVLPLAGVAWQGQFPDLRIAKAIHSVVIDHSYCLHESITYRRPDEAETTLFQVLAHLV